MVRRRPPALGRSRGHTPPLGGRLAKAWLLSCSGGRQAAYLEVFGGSIPNAPIDQYKCDPNQTQVDSERHAGQHSRGFGIYVAFVPWILFTFVGERSTLVIGALVAFASAVVIALPSARVHRLKMLEIGGVVAFAGFSLVAIVADHSTTVFMARYARAIAAAVLATIALTSLVFTPFTEQYAFDLESHRPVRLLTVTVRDRHVLLWGRR